MTLARAWTQRILGASLVAVLVPGAVLGAVAVAALTGGLGRIGDLAQALSGPQVPPLPAAQAPRGTHHPAAQRPSFVTPRPAGRAGAVARHSGSPAPTAPRVAAPGPPISSGGVAAGGTGAGAGSGSPGRGGGHAPGSGGGSTPAPGGGSSAPGSPGSPGSPGAPGSPGSPGAPGAGTGDPSPPVSPPTLTDRVIGVASVVTSRLPDPAETAATEVLNQAGAALDKLVPAPPPGGSGLGGKLP